MKITLFVLTLLSTSFLTHSAHAQDSEMQAGVKINLAVPNGLEVGGDFQPNENFRAGASYGYLHYADAVNLQVQGGFKHVYLFGTIDFLNANGYGRNAIADAVNKTIADASNNNSSAQAGLSGIRFKQTDFKMTDFGVGGGIGVKFGVFFLDVGFRTTRIKQLANDKIDMFVDHVETYIDQNPNLTPDQRASAKAQIESTRTDTKNQLLQAYQSVPGDLNIIPVVRIGVRIPIGL